ncbi:hypothetical protein BMW23_0446 [Bodo saltans virus]|uniref:Uncharacterized protein n=1 Tax=Bodo saltans virus TaxID=2024608 RepID=A0A2H4UUB6_9VIRU|nr:hypothetical protein QJ851_gp0435 [Bodo saltans virus]ATZ80498.1 hypothetical protein BMW23_0446 [Bodo saltans virus]
MPQKQIIKIQNKFYIFEKDLFEPNELFYKRIWFILNNLNNDDFDTLIKKSRINNNIEYLECTYDFQ